MKNLLIFVSFVFLLLFNPMHYYAEYHLRSFDSGVLFHFFRLVYTPSDYNNELLGIFIYDGEEMVVHLNHKYKGSYKIIMHGDHVSNKNLDFAIVFDCQDRKASFTQDQQKHTDLFKLNARYMTIGWYSVSADMAHKETCKIKADLGGVNTPVFLRIMIGNHL